MSNCRRKVPKNKKSRLLFKNGNYCIKGAEIKVKELKKADLLVCKQNFQKDDYS